MAPTDIGTITGLLKELGDNSLEPRDREKAESQLLDLVYPILRQKAGNAMRRERADHTLGSTGLLHEVYLEIFHDAEIKWEDRRHFFNMVARKIRQILVDHARGKARERRGGGHHLVPLTTSSGQVAGGASGNSHVTMIFEDVLTRLESEDPLAVKVGERHFYCGFTLSETAELLDVSLSTVEKKKKKVKDLVMESYINARLGNERQSASGIIPGAKGGKESS